MKNKSKYNFLWKKAYTLIEAFIVLGIGIILVTILTTALVQMQAIFYTTDLSTNLQNEGRLALGRLSADLKRVDSRDLLVPLWHQVNITQDSPEPGTDSLLYHLPQDTTPVDGMPDLDSDGNLIWSSTNITVAVDTSTRQLIRTTGLAQEVLANNVERINFVNHQIDSALPVDNIRVSLELQKITPAGRLIIDETVSIVDMRN